MLILKNHKFLSASFVFPGMIKFASKNSKIQSVHSHIELSS